jgi:hypothetical protein
MKLGKLLAAGKSVKSQGVALSYRSNKQVYLPKFGSEKNPFKSEAAPDAMATADAVADAPPAPKEGSKSATARADFGAAAVAEAHAFKAISPVPTPVPAAAPAPKVSKPAVAPKPASAPAVAAAPVSAPKKSSDWVYKFNPASLFRSTVSKAAAKPFAAKMQKTATQTELSLDSVKVVHNDLSDVDVEVVPMKSRSGAPENQPAKKSWEFIGERLFGVEAT